MMSPTLSTVLAGTSSWIHCPTFCCSGSTCQQVSGLLSIALAALQNVLPSRSSLRNDEASNPALAGTEAARTDRAHRVWSRRVIEASEDPQPGGRGPLGGSRDGCLTRHPPDPF